MEYLTVDGIDEYQGWEIRQTTLGRVHKWFVPHVILTLEYRYKNGTQLFLLQNRVYQLMDRGRSIVVTVKCWE
jgi:hypothetical protein